jgi:hypothetical protein
MHLMGIVTRKLLEVQNLSPPALGSGRLQVTNDTKAFSRSGQTGMALQSHFRLELFSSSRTRLALPIPTFVPV